MHYRPANVLARAATQLALILLMAAGLRAESRATPGLGDAEDGDWWLRSTTYGWITMQSGDLRIGTLGVPVKIGLSDALASLDEIDMAFMGGFEAGRGRWSVGVDATYAKISDDFAGDGTTYSSLRLEQAAWMINPYAAYRLASQSEWKVDVIFGARYNSLEMDLVGRYVAGGQAAAGGRRSWTDPIVGFRGQKSLSEKLLLGFRGDIGGFGVASRFTWQGYVGLGWQLKPNMTASFGYRAISTDYSREDFASDTLTHGPLFGLMVKF